MVQVVPEPMAGSNTNVAPAKKRRTAEPIVTRAFACSSTASFEEAMQGDSAAAASERRELATPLSQYVVGASTRTAIDGVASDLDQSVQAEAATVLRTGVACVCSHCSPCVACRHWR